MHNHPESRQRVALRYRYCYRCSGQLKVMPYAHKYCVLRIFNLTNLQIPHRTIYLVDYARMCVTDSLCKMPSGRVKSYSCCCRWPAAVSLTLAQCHTMNMPRPWNLDAVTIHIATAPPPLGFNRWNLS